MAALALARFAVLLLRARLAARLANGPRRAGERGQVVPQWIYITAISVAAAAVIGGLLWGWMHDQATSITSH